jgi:hypothetical protein
VPTEDDVNGSLSSRGSKYGERICEPALHRRKLPNPRRQLVRRRHEPARHHDQFANPVAGRKRGEQVTIVLRDPAAPTERIAHERENSQRRIGQRAAVQTAAT